MILEKQILKELTKVIHMRRYFLILTIAMFGQKSYSQTDQGNLIMDTVEVMSLYNFLDDSEKEIIGYDQYFIYKNQLFNNAIESSLYLCNLKYMDNINSIGRFYGKSKFYKRIRNGSGFKKWGIKDFAASHPKIFLVDSSLLARYETSKTIVYSKKFLFIFYSFKCNDIDETLLAGGGTHSKIFERFFYFAWKGYFILPLQLID